ncbi:CDP-glycerol glycerophosphotransferase family protein [Vagococcus lutrae]|uniref:CDP-glycerol glycerophosphotransferase family protein n=1 Tax=Vagococcus lutrae TaxID=81947 RepID=UPI00288F82AD|nr:CDP-glycerol glycerophosphotransferase family protein [Vagococcus lutrae]MDT2842087.1 CDP-glycerol glycerophosphotransferase family protein [Vagococcus lutrae]
MNKVIHFFKLIILYGSKIIPKNKSRYIYGSWFGQKFSDNSAYMYISNINNPKYKRIQHVWITKNKEVYKKMVMNDLKCYMAYSFKGIFYQITASKVFVSTGTNDVLDSLIGGAQVINLWHGVPLKKIMYDVNKQTLGERLRSRATYNYVLSTSSKMRNNYMSAFNLPKRQCIISQQPRTDIFFITDNTFDIFKKIPKALEIRIKNKKIVLYAPTHRSEGKVFLDIENKIDLNLLNQELEIRDTILLIKKHFYHRNEKIESTYNNIFDITDIDVDVQQLLSMSHILITDYSSIFIDYLLLDRPIIFFSYDIEDYLREERLMYFNYENVASFNRVYDGEELTAMILNTLDGIKYHEWHPSEAQINLKNLFFEYPSSLGCNHIMRTIGECE